MRIFKIHFALISLKLIKILYNKIKKLFFKIVVVAFHPFDVSIN